MSDFKIKSLALLVSSLMVIEMVPQIVFATENEDVPADTTVTETTVTEEDKTEPEDETPSESESDKQSGEEETQAPEDSKPAEESSAEETKIEESTPTEKDENKTEVGDTKTVVVSEPKNNTSGEEGTAELPFVPAGDEIYGDCGENAKFTFYISEGYLAVSGSGPMFDYESDDELGSTAPWAEFKDEIKSINIVSGVTSIGECAFYGCKNLTSVSIPGSITSIGDLAFSNCTKLESVELPESLTSIDMGVFSYCTNLKSIGLPDTITEIGNEAFMYSGLESVLIPRSVKSIGGYAFAYCKSLTEVGLSKRLYDHHDATVFTGSDKAELYYFDDTVNYLYLPSSSVNVAKGGTYTLQPSSSSAVTYKSSNVKIAKIDAKGKITGVSIGTTTITVSLKSNPSIRQTCKVNVKYRMYYSLNGGTNNSGNPSFYTGTLSLKNPTKKNFTFKGWYTNKYFKNYTKVTKVKNANKTVYAKWARNSYTIKFNPNGSSKKAYSQKCNAGSTYNLMANKFSRMGYTFVGWNTKADGSGVPYINKQAVMDLTTKNGATVNLYAQWSLNTYNITYNGLIDGDVNPNTVTSYTVNTPNISLFSAKRTDYTFNGWYTDSEFKNKITSINKGSTGNKNLYAKFTINYYIVKFNPNGASGSAYTQKCNVTTEYNLTANKFYRKGYSFLGWNTKADGSGTSYSDKQLIQDLSMTNGTTINLYAQWKKNIYSINYVGLPDGARINNPTTYSVTSSNFKLKNPIVTGYAFNGWYTNSAKTKRTYNVSCKGVTGNKTIYAKVTANKYDILFNANGGKGSVATMKNAYYGKTYTLRKNAFTREGYEFTGWNTKADGSGTAYADEAPVSNLTTKNKVTVTLYAQWSKLNDPVVPVEKLNMSINEVEQAILAKLGNDYYDFTNEHGWYAERVESNKARGMLNYVSFGIYKMTNEKQFDGYQSIYVCFDVYEYDMNSEEYKNICKTNTVRIKGEGDWYDTYEVAAINKQYVLVVQAMYGSGYGFDNESDPSENLAPFTIGKAQAGYEAFIALK